MSETNIVLNCRFSYQEINKLMKPFVRGIQLTDNLQLDSMLVKGEEDWVFGVARLKGSYNGKMIISCIPVYDSKYEKFEFQKLTVDLGKSSILAIGANWLLKRFFAEKLDKKLEEIANNRFRDLIEDFLENAREFEVEGLRASGDFSLKNIEDIRSDGDFLLCKVTLSGEIHVTLH